MGWSCNAAASLTLDAIVAIQEKLGAEGSNNIAIEGKQVGFWEASRVEHDDGAITGSVYTLVGPDNRCCRKTGSFRIEGNGKITRFSSIPRRLLIQAEKKGAEEFIRRYGITQAEKENVKV